MSEPVEIAPARRAARLSLGRVAQIAITVVCVALLLAFVDLRRVATLVAAADPGLLAAALGVAAFDRFLMIAKWYPLLVVQAPAIPFVEGARSYLVANFTNYFLPSTLGSDALRAAALGRRHGLVFEVGASIAAERLGGILANAVLAAVSLLVAIDRAVPVGAAGVIAVAVLSGVGLLALLLLGEGFRGFLRRRLPARWLAGPESWLGRFSNAYLEYRRHPRLLAGVGVLTAIEVCLPMAIVWVLALALGVSLGLAELVVAVPISMLVAKVPISIAGIGPQEATLVSLFELLGVPRDTGFALAALSRVLDVVIALPGAFLWRDWARGLTNRG